MLGSWLGLYDKLDDIQCQYVSDEACLKAVVEEFLLRYQPSWRRVIHALHGAGESHLAEKIKANAEPHQGVYVCMWVGNIIYMWYM